MDGAVDTDLTTRHQALADQLVAAGRLIPTAFQGLYGRDAVFESIVDGIAKLVVRAGAVHAPTHVHYPPIIPAGDFDRIGYLRSFPNLAGVAFTFRGDDREFQELVRRLDAGDNVSDTLEPAGVTLIPACCYPVYPSVAGTLAEGGRCFAICNYCFRNEPSVDPMRMVAFRQHEHVRIGAEEEVLQFRDSWLERAGGVFDDLQLPATADFANDPFFGRAGRMMARTQLEQQLKTEFLIPVHGDDSPTACASVNYHQDHFGHIFDIHTADGGPAHSSCIGFGMERITVAMLRYHGMDPDGWPAALRERLWP